jgi:hypothetical protein
VVSTCETVAIVKRATACVHVVSIHPRAPPTTTLDELSIHSDDVPVCDPRSCRSYACCIHSRPLRRAA